MSKFELEKIMSSVNLSMSKKYDSYDNVKTIKIVQDGNCYRVSGIVDVLGREYEYSFCYDDEGHVFEYHCQCIWCSESSPCAHIGSVLIKLNELEIDKYPFYYESDKQKREDEMQRRQEAIHREFMEKYKQQELLSKSLDTRNYIIENKESYQNKIYSLIQNEKYDITPIFNGEEGQITLTYKIGNGKKYIIKNITTFLENIDHHNNVKYGKFLSFVHHEDAFTDFAKKQIEFMRKANDAYDHFQRKYYYYPGYGHFHLQRELIVTSGSLDDFYELYKDYDFDSLKMKDIDKLLELEIKDEGQYYEIYITDVDTFYFGENHIYLFESGRKQVISRIELDQGGKCVDFINMFTDDESIVVKKEDFADFYKYVLSPIEAYFHISQDIPIETNEYQTIKIFGDIDEDSRLVFKVYYEDENQNRVIAFQSDFITNYQQDIVEKYIQSHCLYIDDQTHYVYFDINDEKTYEFIHDGLKMLEEYCEVYVSDALKNIGRSVNYSMTVGIKVEHDLLSLNIDTEDIPKMEISKILTQYKRKKKFYRLKTGELLSLDSPQIEELSNFMDQYHIEPKDIQNGKMQLSKNRAFSIDEDANNLEYIKIDRQDSFKKIMKEYNQNPDYTIPEAYQSVLRDYQKAGYQWLKTLYDNGFNGILADDMGLGKTLQVIVLLESLKTKLPSIVICPSSLIYNWEDEIHKFSKKLKVKCVVGNQASRNDIIKQASHYDVLVTSYDYMRRDYELYNDILFEYIILDESQYIKNQKTKNAYSVKQLKGKHKLALSGTPIENSLAELWSVFDFLMPQYLFNYHYFQKHYESQIVKNHDKDTISKLQKLVSPFILRRKKDEVLKELPDKIETVQLIPFDTKENELYLANLSLVNTQLQELFQMEKVDKIQVLSLLTKLRQICCEPRMLYENITHASSKMKACMDLIKNYKESHQKVLLFSTFTQVLDLITNELDMNGIKYFQLTGKTSKETRKELVERFQNGEADVFLISLKAGGTGLNLTRAEAVIHFDPWWNVSAQNQATDRAYRIGQKKNVQVHKLIMKDSIEEKMLGLQEKKKELADMFVETSEGNIASLSKEDIMELLS